MTRRALVHGARDAATVAAYMPANYRVTESDTGPDGRTVVTIEGVDSAGWTLEGYVIPRLASGLMWAREIE